MFPAFTSWCLAPRYYHMSLGTIVVPYQGIHYLYLRDGNVAFHMKLWVTTVHILVPYSGMFENPPFDLGSLHHDIILGPEVDNLVP